ncbi:MAG: hypothetical protein H5T86_07135 [Armatimonadetes bacterium]|nr:hypothetical protein [Armatimonadota bacterium]
MSYLIAALLIAVIAVFEAAWPPWLYWGGERPELAVAAVMSAGLVLGAAAGLEAAFFAALYRGALEAQPWGGLFVGYFAVGLLAGTIGHKLLVRRALAAFLPAAIAVALFRLIILVFQPPSSLALWAAGTGRATVYTAVIGIVLHGLFLSALNRFQPQAEIWR